MQAEVIMMTLSGDISPSSSAVNGKTDPPIGYITVLLMAWGYIIFDTCILQFRHSALIPVRGGHFHRVLLTCQIYTL